MGNVYFLLIVILYLLIKNIHSKYFLESYKNGGNNFFVEPNVRFSDFKILSLNYQKEEKPTLLTDYKFSESYKLGFELSKIMNIKFTHSDGMYNNIHKMLNQGSQYQLCLCTENDIFNYLEKNEDKKDLIRVICSFYRMEMIFLINAKFQINSVDEIKNKIQEMKRQRKTFKLGILDEKHSSHIDAYKILNCMNIDYRTSSDVSGIEIKKYSNMRELIHYFDKNDVDFIYLTTTSKNRYIIELLKKNFVNIVGISDVGESLLRTKFEILHKNLVNTSKYNRIIQENDNLFSYNSSEMMGKQLNTNTFSTRLFLICRKELNEQIIYDFTRTIYRNRVKIKEKMDKYFLTVKNNVLDKLMNPFEMFFISEKLKYHNGAKKHYRNIGFISNNENMTLINKKVKSKLLLDVNGPYQKLFTRK